MTTQSFSASNPRPSAAASLVIFLAATAFMILLKLLLVPHRYLAFGYVLPLLLCLWHQDRRLLWALALAFAAISALKNFVVLPGRPAEEPFELLQWLMQCLNLAVVAGTVHGILNLTDRLRARNRELHAANDELTARGEEIARQNTELQAQSEELVQQNEELQQQSEELGRQNEEMAQQAEELEQQSEELQRQSRQLLAANHELNQREAMLQTLLGSLGEVQDERQMLERVCQALNDLIGQPGTVAAVMEQLDDTLVLQTQSGTTPLTQKQRPFAGSFAAVVMEHNRTAFVDDLSAHPDLDVPQPAERVFRSVLATPLRLHGKPIGVVKICSLDPQKWTTRHFRIIEWIGAQCSLALGIGRLQQDLAQTNANLEQQVRQRTARLQEMVNELEHFSYSITHDMRAPLRAMQGFASLLRELCGTNLNNESMLCLDRICSSARRMDRLITDALSYSQTVKSELALSPIDAAELLRGIIESYPQFQPPSSQVTLSGKFPRLLANEAGLTQCFSNLLDNAVKFVGPGRLPRISVWAEAREDSVRLWFEDNGIGIPEGFVPRLFQMFQRASRSYEGTGIGLALVRKVTERMGGRVGVESKQGSGSRFWLEFKRDQGSDGLDNGSPRFDAPEMGSQRHTQQEHSRRLSAGRQPLKAGATREEGL